MFKCKIGIKLFMYQIVSLCAANGKLSKVQNLIACDANYYLKILSRYSCQNYLDGDGIFKNRYLVAFGEKPRSLMRF